MMLAFRHQPIRRKLLLIILATIAASLVLVMAGIVIYEIATYRQRLADRITEVASFIALNSAPSLAFEDPVTARETLATLASYPEITIGALYTSDDSLFASYTSDPISVMPPPAPGFEGVRLAGRKLEIVQAIEQRGLPLGTLYIRAETAPLSSRLAPYAGILLVTALAIGAGAFLLQRLLQRLISEPLLRLSKVAESIASGDLAVHVSVESEDEIGQLAGAFNHMTSELAQSYAVLKEREGRLRDNEATLRLAIEITGLGTFDFYPATGELIWSDLAKLHFGLSPGAHVDYPVFLSGLHPEDRERVDKLVQSVLKPESGGQYRTEYRTIGIEDKKDRWLTAHGQVFFDEKGEPVRFIGATLDITERKQAEERLRVSENRYTMLFNAIDEGFCIIQMIFDENEKPIDYRFLETNPAFERQSGLVDVEGKRMRELAPQHEEHWFESYGKIALTGQPARFENPADQLGRWYDVYAFRFGQPENRQVAVLFNDITERKLAEAEMHRLTAELERRVQERTAELTAANQELEAFTYTVSHDLRAPLRHVTSFVELLVEDAGPKLDEEAREHLADIADASNRMGALIEDLLTFSRIGRAPIAETVVDLGQIVKEVRRELEPETVGRAIDWGIGSLPQVRGDSTLLRTAVINLISNAIKYTRHRSPARIEVGSRKENGEAICYVRDNGAGFDMRFADKLFGVFQRLHPEEEFEGTGIGLASVRRIIQRHGGRVWAEGEVDRGATFYFSLRPAAGLSAEETKHDRR